MRAMIMLTVMTGQCHDNHVDDVHVGDYLSVAADFGLMCTMLAMMLMMLVMMMVMTFQWQRTLASCRAGLPGARVRPRRSKSTWIIIIVKMLAITFGGGQR